MSICDPVEMKTIVRIDPKEKGYKNSIGYANINGKVIPVEIKEYMEIYPCGRNNIIAEFINGAFKLEVITDKGIIKKIKEKLNIPLKKEEKLFETNGTLYSPDFFSIYFPEGFLSPKTIYKTKEEAKKGQEDKTIKMFNSK